MLLALPAISFLCAALLSLFLLVPRIYSNFVNLSLVLWLLVANLIHGINALVWSGNTDIHIPAWCDIVTKLLLGANVAIPCVCVCIAIDLEHLSSKRRIVTNTYIEKARLLFHVILCLLFPVLYMSLHFIAQDHRFNILKDFGPFASIHPSTPALLIIWLPPLIVCSISFLFSGFAMSHSFSYSPYNFRAHLDARCSMTSSLFFRRIVTTVTLTCVVAVVNLFALFSPPDIVPWKSWDSVHEHSQEVRIITKGDDVANAKLMWWGIPITSLVYLLLSLIIGEEVREAGRWTIKVCSSLKHRRWKFNIPSLRPSTLLPIHRQTAQDADMALHPRNQQPHLTLNLKSGWDDMLHDKRTPTRTKSLNTSKSRSTTPSSPARSPSPSSPEDEAFKQSTLDYLDSPVALSLGLQSPLISSPSSIYTTSSPNKVFIERPSPGLLPIPRQPIPEDASSTISSIMDASWPLPPTSVTPPSLRSQSSTLSDQYTICSTPRSVTPPPFQGSGISIAAIDSSEAKLSVKSHAGWPSVSSLRRNRSTKTHSAVSGEMVYMTVVQETIS